MSPEARAIQWKCPTVLAIAQFDSATQLLCNVILKVCRSLLIRWQAICLVGVLSVYTFKLVATYLPYFAMTVLSCELSPFFIGTGQWRCRNPIHRWVQSLVVFGHRQLKLLGSMLATFKGHRAPAVCFTSFHCMFHWFHLVSIHPWYDNKLDRRYVVLKAGMELKVEAVRLPNPCNNLWFLVVFVERYASESQPGTTKSQYLPRERASTTRPLNLAEVVDVSVACSCKAWTIWMVERHMRCGGSGYHCQGKWSEVVWMIYDKQDA